MYKSRPRQLVEKKLRNIYTLEIVRSSVPGIYMSLRLRLCFVFYSFMSVSVVCEALE